MVTLLSCIERASGFLYRIFLSRTMGAQGLGLYQIALSVIGVLITISSSGIPITVSRLMIKEKTKGTVNGENKAVTAGIFVSLAVSLPICILCFLLKDKLTFLFADKRCVVLFLIILPGVVLTSVYAVIRGFFWGTKSFLTYSIIELMEELVMILCGVVFVLRSKTLMEKSVWASCAVLISYIFSFTISFAMFIFKGGKLKNPISQLKPLFFSSAPITFMKTSSSLTSSFVALILPAMMIFYGIPKEQAISDFGVISGMTLPLLFIPSTLIGSLALVLSPLLCENFYKKNMKKVKSDIEKSLVYCLLICCVIIPCFAGSGVYIGKFLYNNKLSGIYLRYSAFVMIPMSITMISQSLLNSVGYEKKTLLYFIISSCFMILSIIFLPKFIGNYSLIAGFFLCFFVNSLFNLKLLTKVCGEKLEFVKKLFVSLPLCLVSCFFDYFAFSLLSKFLNEFLAFLISGILSVVWSCLLIVIFKVINIKDLKKIRL